MGRNIPKSIWLRSFRSAAITSGRPTRKLILAPVTLKDLERLKNSTPVSFAPGVARKLPPCSAVVNDIAVGVVVDNKDIVFPAELHRFLHKAL